MPIGTSGDQERAAWEVPATVDLSTGPADNSGWGQAVLWAPARWHGVLSLAVIFCAYVGSVLIYPLLAPDGVALLWLPNAVLVTALLKFRPRDWPYVYAVCLVAEVVGDLTFDVAPHQAFYFGVVNAIEATLFVLFAALIVGRRHSIGLLSVRGALAVAGASVTIPALTGALGAVGSVWTFDADYLTAWRSWWFGDGLGLLVGVPIGLLLRDTARSVCRRRSVPLTLGGGSAATLLGVVSATLAVAGRSWGAQQTALAAGVLLSLTFGAVGAPIAAVLATTVTLIGEAQQEAGLDFVVRDQTLLFVVVAAIYAIAATTESGDRAMEQLSRARNDLARLSRTDDLTGMSNRRGLSENLELLWAWSARESKPVAMLMADIDCFHQYNETYGHVSGDSVIRRISSAMRSSGSRRKTDLVVRYGGEEFLMVIPDATLEYAREVAARIHQQVKELNIEHSSSPVAPIVTVSIGVLEITKAAPGSAITSLERCDALLFEAKRAGRNRTVAERLQLSDSFQVADQS